VDLTGAEHLHAAVFQVLLALSLLSRGREGRLHPGLDYPALITTSPTDTVLQRV
jgi:hypothetical protein